MKKNRVIGFNAYDNNDDEPQERETKIDFVKVALAKYLTHYKPYDPGDAKNEITFKTSKEIQEEISEMVTASISQITEFMMQHHYNMELIEGGKLVWAMQDFPTIA